ncbi:tryptophan synthase beta chain [Diplonema papillatum]|nr:tryptophan synthase beta chain [Diplonema papillatum]
MACGADAIRDVFNSKFANLVYVTACYPTEEKSLDILMACQESGCVGIVEVGIPFTDPVGDGPVIEECALDAMKQKCSSVFQVIELVQKARARGFILPVILMGYYNTFLSGWVEKAKGCVSGVIIVDLPSEEPETVRVAAQCRSNGMTFIPLVTPFTREERLRKISSSVDTFLYCTCVLGVTGARESLANYLATDYQPVWKRTTENTIGCKKILGFGVSNNAAVKAVRNLGADGLVVGSALMRVCISLIPDPERNQIWCVSHLRLAGVCQVLCTKSTGNSGKQGSSGWRASVGNSILLANTVCGVVAACVHHGETLKARRIGNSNLLASSVCGVCGSLPSVWRSIADMNRSSWLLAFLLEPPTGKSMCQLS